jgi:hypothetical protein
MACLNLGHLKAATGALYSALLFSQYAEYRAGLLLTDSCGWK